MKVKLKFPSSEELLDWQYGLVSNEEAPDVEAIGSETTTKDDILKELNLEDETDTEQPDKDRVESEEDDEEDNEGKERDDDDEEEEDEEIEIKEPGEEEEERLVVPVKKAEILKKYPNLEKEFPALFAYYYKAQQYTDIIPTVADAKRVVKDSETLDNFRKDLEEGNTVKVIAAIKDYSPENYDKFVDNYLQTLATVDKEAYFHVTNNVLANAIQFGLAKAKENNDEDVKEAILIFNEFLFGQKEPVQIRLRAKKEESDESQKLKKEREDFENQKFTDAIGEVTSRVNNQVMSTIDANIDKDGKMTAFVKRNAVKEVKDKLDDALKNDKAFQSVINSLQKRAKAEKLSSIALDKIKRAYLTQAKTYLQRIIPKVRAEALKGSSSVRRQEPTRFRSSTSSEENKSGNNSSSKRDSKNSKDGRGMRTVDFLNS